MANFLCKGRRHAPDRLRQGLADALVPTDPHNDLADVPAREQARFSRQQLVEAPSFIIDRGERIIFQPAPQVGCEFGAPMDEMGL